MKVQKSRKRRSKPIKKNTWRRDFKAWRLRLDRRQRLRDTMPDHDESSRVCSNCGQEYVGRYCPQCGQSGVWNRYTFRQVVLNFLDIWGLGNRPMFRTLRDLFWRPGYMAQDYLNGHRQFYFPPFKLFALTVVALMFSMFLTGEKYESVLGFFVNRAALDSMNLPPSLAALVHGFVLFARFLASNPLYDMLFLGVCLLCCIHASFRRFSPYNMVETFIFLVFVLIQCNLYIIVGTLVSSLYHAVGVWVMSMDVVASSPALVAVARGVDWIASAVSMIYSILLLLLYVCDFKQFYGLSFWTTAWRLMLAVIYGLLALLLLAAMVMTTRRSGYQWTVTFVLGIALFVGVNHWVKQYLNASRSLLSKTVSRLTRVTLIFCFVSSPIVAIICAKNGHGGHSATRATLALVVCAAMTLAVSLLPPYLYKKYRRTWLSLLPPLALVALLVALQRLSH